MDPEVKSQPVRLLDVVFIGPMMIWGGHALDARGHGLGGAVLALLGLSTILYNAHNFDVVRRRQGTTHA
jgi:hypothetical protein